MLLLFLFFFVFCCFCFVFVVVVVVIVAVVVVIIELLCCCCCCCCCFVPKGQKKLFIYEWDAFTFGRVEVGGILSDLFLRAPMNSRNNMDG